LIESVVAAEALGVIVLRSGILARGPIGLIP
jgi:hypothetical protein